MNKNSKRLIQNTSQLLTKAYLKRLLNSFCCPVDYTRTTEIPCLLDVSDILYRKNEPLQILDIGSPQVLSLSLATFSNKWNITYINPFQPELDDLEERKTILRIKNILIKYGDITDAGYCGQLGQYDYIFSCSVFEHIYPEYGGDVIASKNVSILLKYNGIFAFSVPFYKDGFHEYKYEQVYSIKSLPNDKLFFQRFYYETKLEDQIIKPSGLVVHNKIYVGERYYYPQNIHKRFAFLVGGKNKSLLFGRFYFLLSKLFMTIDQNPNNLSKPYLAIISLRK